MNRNVRTVINKIARRNGISTETVTTIFNELNAEGLISQTNFGQVEFKNHRSPIRPNDCVRMPDGSLYRLEPYQ